MKPGHLAVKRLSILLQSLLQRSALSVPWWEAPSLFLGRDGRPGLPRPRLTLGGGAGWHTASQEGMRIWVPSWALSETLGEVRARAPQLGEGMGGLAVLCVWVKGAAGLPGWAAPPLVLQQEQLLLGLALCAGRSPRPRVLASRAEAPGWLACVRRAASSVAPEALAALGEGQGGGRVLRRPRSQRLELNFSNDRRTQKQGQRF